MTAIKARPVTGSYLVAGRRYGQRRYGDGTYGEVAAVSTFTYTRSVAIPLIHGPVQAPGTRRTYGQFDYGSEYFG
jgi:hypothetical protein